MVIIFLVGKINAPRQLLDSNLVLIIRQEKRPSFGKCLANCAVESSELRYFFTSGEG